MSVPRSGPPPKIPLPIAPTSSRFGGISTNGDYLSATTSVRSGPGRKPSHDTFGPGGRSPAMPVRNIKDDGSPDEETESSTYEDEHDQVYDTENESVLQIKMARHDDRRLRDSNPTPYFPEPPTREARHAPSSPSSQWRNFSPPLSVHRSKAYQSQSNPRQRGNGSASQTSLRMRHDDGRDSSQSIHGQHRSAYQGSRPASPSSQGTSSPTDFYRRTGAKTDLDSWNPPAVPPRAGKYSASLHGTITNLPDWTSLRGDEPTSHPVGHVQKDIEFSILRLVSPAVFEQLLSDPLGRHRFREYLNTCEEGGSKDLDFVLDVREHMRAIDNLKQGSEALHDVYVKNPENRGELAPELDNSLLASLRTTFALQHQLDGVHSHLIQTMFHSAFQRFIRASITEQSRVRLGAFATNDNGDGLGAAFVLTNPRLRDHPIVLVSPAFCDLTGYPQEAILQRNCRFLQGPSTSPESVQRIRDSLNTGTSSIELLLNYTRSGEPFWNLLCIIPLRDAKGRVQYFVGGQVNVTGALTSNGLSFLLGGGRSYENLPDLDSTRRYGVEASPTLLKYYSSTDLPSDQDNRRQADNRSVRQPNPKAAGTSLYDHEPVESDKTKGSNSNSGMMKRFWTGRRKVPLNNQTLGRTAESEARRMGGTVEEHMDDFSATYSRIALIKKSKREILFVTSSLLEYFDLPVSTPQQIYESPLLHADLLSLICGEDRADTKRLRADVQEAIRTGKTLKITVNIRQPARRLFSSGAVLKSTVLHISPLKDVENNTSAAIVVFA